MKPSLTTLKPIEVLKLKFQKNELNKTWLSGGKSNSTRNSFIIYNIHRYIWKSNHRCQIMKQQGLLLIMLVNISGGLFEFTMTRSATVIIKISWLDVRQSKTESLTGFGEGIISSFLLNNSVNDFDQIWSVNSDSFSKNEFNFEHIFLFKILS
jgi:hypothetical protein